MIYVDAKRITQDSKDIPDGEIFTVYSDGEGKVSFAMKMKGEFTLSIPIGNDATKKDVMLAYKQVLYAKENGWSRIQEEGIDETGEKGRIYHCLYCNNQEIEPEQACQCRGKEKVKGMEDFLLPGDW